MIYSLLSIISKPLINKWGISTSGLRILAILILGVGWAFTTHSQVVLLSSGYDILSLGDINLNNGNISGRIAAVGTIFIKNTTIINSPNDSLPVLFAGDRINANNSTIVQGDILYGSSAEIKKNVEITNGYQAYQASSTHPAPFSANNVRQHFENLSLALSSLQQNGTIGPYQNSGRLDLTGNQNINIFNLYLSDYSNLSEIGINAPTGSTVIINVYGQNYQNIIPTLNGIEASHLLFNFVDATSLSFGGFGSYSGTYLAPGASITLSGNLNGQIIGNDIEFKKSDFTRNPFTGSLPSAIPEPSTYAAFLGFAALSFVAFRRYKRTVSTKTDTDSTQ